MNRASVDADELGGVFTSAPPELPGSGAASVWLAFSAVW
jgi:hypothetical protein